MDFIKSADLRSIAPSPSVAYVTEDGVIFVGRTGGAVGAYDDDNRTVFVPTGSNGTSAWVAAGVQTTFGKKQVTYVRAAFGSTATASIGIPTAAVATGTATAATFADTSVYTRMTRVELLDTTEATDSVAGIRTVFEDWTRRVGFLCQTRWGQATGGAIATGRAFCGMIEDDAAPTDVGPSTLVDMIGMGWDDTDTTIQIMHNDATGTATKVDLGAAWPKPVADAADVYDFELFCEPNGTTVYWRVTNVGTGLSATGAITTNIPAIETPLCCLHVYTSVGGTSGVTGVGFSSFYGERAL